MAPLPLVLALMLAQTAEARPPHPLAPSMPQLTAKEEALYEAIIERFIQYDIGKLPGPAGKKALEDFNRLPPEAIFVLVDGFNRAAAMEASCPAVLIGKKIVGILNGSEDLQLLAFAKETLGAGVTSKRHQGLLKDMQFSIQLRKGTVQRKIMTAGPYAVLSLPELLKAVETRADPQRKAAMIEMEKRLAKISGPQLKDLLKHDKAEVKIAAAQAISSRGLKYITELIDLLQNDEVAVSQAGRAALVRLSRGADYGPAPDASVETRQIAVRNWRQWWSQQKP